MEYRGSEYVVVQTANPTGWKWIVNIDGKRIKTGRGLNRALAIVCAEKIIDEYIRTRSENNPLNKEASRLPEK